ncbi:MAG: hypothetical protein PHH14_02415 [Candidatus Margulisbacteria bacterium]|nr:hypothetical protein [Candidatus Margulisiibacteriota bacterium]
MAIHISKDALINKNTELKQMQAGYLRRPAANPSIATTSAGDSASIGAKLYNPTPLVNPNAGLDLPDAVTSSFELCENVSIAEACYHLGKGTPISAKGYDAGIEQAKLRSARRSKID